MWVGRKMRGARVQEAVDFYNPMGGQVCLVHVQSGKMCPPLYSSEGGGQKLHFCFRQGGYFISLSDASPPHPCLLSCQIEIVERNSKLNFKR